MARPTSRTSQTRIEVVSDLDGVRRQLDKEQDPQKITELARIARDLRGHGDLFKFPGKQRSS